MYDASLNIATLSNAADAHILSIAAVAFGREEGKIASEQFYVGIDAQDQDDRDIDPDIVRWWLTIPAPSVAAGALRAEVATPLAEALHGLSVWLHTSPGKHCRVWGDPQLFATLEHAYRSLDMPVPWDRHRLRDIRTLFDTVLYVGHNVLALQRGTTEVALDGTVAAATANAGIIVDAGRLLRDKFR